MDPEVEALYGLPLGEFTAARDALAKAKRKDGDAEAAAAIKALRKPSPAVWAVNQLARRRKGDVDGLLDAGGRLRHAQTAALDGDPSDLREATRAEAAEVEAVAGLAAAMLAEAGRPPSAAQRERMATTLRAAAVDPVGGEQLARGVLQTELDPAGFGFGTATGEPESIRPPAAPAGPRQSKEHRARARAEEAAATQEAREARRREVERQKALRHADQELDRLERDANEAEARAVAARAAADAARGRAEALRTEVEGPQNEQGRKG